MIQIYVVARRSCRRARTSSCALDRPRRRVGRERARARGAAANDSREARRVGRDHDLLRGLRPTRAQHEPDAGLCRGRCRSARSPRTSSGRGRSRAVLRCRARRRFRTDRRRRTPLNAIAAPVAPPLRRIPSCSCGPSRRGARMPATIAATATASTSAYAHQRRPLRARARCGRLSRSTGLGAMNVRSASAAPISARHWRSSHANSSIEREAAQRVLLERALDGGDEPQRDVGALLGQVRRRLVHVLHRNGDEVLARERHLGGQQLVEDDAERVHVGRGRDRLTARLLGREVVARAEHRAGLRHALLDVERARDPEVGHLRLAVAVEQDVLRLHVAMYEPMLVREGERVGDRQRELDARVAPEAGPSARRAASGSRRRRTRRR